MTLTCRRQIIASLFLYVEDKLMLFSNTVLIFSAVALDETMFLIDCAL